MSAAKYIGKVCEKHPELGGERYVRGRHCPKCNCESHAKLILKRKSEGPSYFGKICIKHPELNGERTSVGGHCLPCERTRSAARRKQRTEKTGVSYNRKYNLGRRNFSIDLFNRTIALQKYRCAICLRPLSTLPRYRIHADHCHKTKTPRGVLCSNCNHLLGHSKDSPAILQAAIEYLQHYEIEALI